MTWICFYKKDFWSDRIEFVNKWFEALMRDDNTRFIVIMLAIILGLIILAFIIIGLSGGETAQAKAEKEKRALEDRERKLEKKKKELEQAQKQLEKDKNKIYK